MVGVERESLFVENETRLKKSSDNVMIEDFQLKTSSLKKKL